MGEMKIWKVEEIEANIGPAAATGRKFGAVDVIVTERVQDASGAWIIKFKVWGDTARRTFEAEWGNPAHMWAPCPSTLPSEATFDQKGAAPDKMAFGRLYLSKEFLDTNHITAEPKWPPSLSVMAQYGEEIEVYPLKLELTGLEMKSGMLRQATVDLLDPVLAASHQWIELDGSSPVKVRLTQTALLTKFHLPSSPSPHALDAALGVWKSRVVRSQPELAEAMTVIAAALTHAASADPDDEISRRVREPLGRILDGLASR